MLNLPIFEKSLSGRPLELEQDALHLWTTAVPKAMPLEEVARCAPMTSDEREREATLRSDHDKRAYRWARVVTRAVLSRYVVMDPLKLRYTKNASGKPEIAYPPGSALQFSLSHTADIVVLLVSRHRMVGVDVESERRFTPAELPLSLLGAAAISELQSLPRERQVRRFLEHWTLKESYAKARGSGLVLPLDRYEFGIDAEGVRADIDPTLDADPGRWWFSLPRIPGFVAALAASLHESGETPPKVRVFSALGRGV